MKDWRTWVMLIGVFFLIQMCGGCSGCSSMRTCERCGKRFEPKFEDSKWCSSCYAQHSKEFNEKWKKREKAIPVRAYQTQKT